MLVVYLFLVVDVLTAVSAMLKGAVWPGVAGLIGPLLCLVAAAGTKGVLVEGQAGSKVGSVITGTILLVAGLVMLYLSGYRVFLFGLELAGPVWGLVGGALGLLFVPASMAFARRGP